MIKRKINLLLVLFIFVLSFVFIEFSSDIKANDENKYWTYVQIEYKEVNYKLNDYPEYDKYNIQDKDFLNKQRILKIPYLVYNIASKEFSKNLDIDDVTLEYKKSRMSEDLKRVYAKKRCKI